MDLYVLVVRLVGVWLAFSGVIYLSMLPGVGVDLLAAWAVSVGVYGTTAFLLLRYPRAIARWLAREDGEKTLALGLGAGDLQSVLVFAIGFYLIVTGVPSLVAALVPQPYQPGSRWQEVVRPGVPILVGVLVLTRRRWLPALVRAVEAWRKSRED
ncbi:MAG: hypothetical protein N2320_01815 [Candidatus Bipolaricaulota bacterium]|nr:hypothetical protein [Candidatus Bipolaricaulota bacterium]